METVAIVGPVNELGRTALRAQLGEDFRIIEIASEQDFDLLDDVEYVILRSLRLDAEVIRRCGRLKLIQRWGAGYDSVDVAAAGRQGVPVAITYGVNTAPVAEFTILLMLAVLRQLVVQDRNVRSGRWRDESLTRKTFLLRGRTVGLLGYGNIGRQVGTYAQAFGAEIIYHDPFRAEETAAGSARHVSFDELVERSDVLSIHIPLTEDSKGLIGEKVLNRMKRTAVLVNTSRGGIVDEADLYQALIDESILGAGLDVFESEPAAASNPLFSLHNVVVSAHAAGNTADNSVHMATTCSNHIRAVSQGLDLPTPAVVNREFLLSPREPELGSARKVQSS